jgi:hypothetical protein
VAAARTALERSRADDAEVSDTAPLWLPAEEPAAAEARRSRQHGAVRRPPARPRAGQPRLTLNAVRGLLVTPWFAAGTGIVIAVGLWMYSPHAVLKFPSSRLGEEPCPQQGCGSATGPALAVSTPGVPIGHPGQSAGKNAQHADVGRGSAASGLTFNFTVLWQQSGAFSAMLSVTSKRPISATWRLAFTMPGDQITSVTGAAWQPSGIDGGTARAIAGSPGPGWPGDGSGQRQYVVSFTVIGSGTPVTPTRCVYDGASCTFS